MRIGELTTKEAMKALKTFQDARVVKICFTGGEPFDRNDFSSLLEQAAMFGMRSAVITNATLLKEATFKMVKRLGVELGVSLDGADERTNDTIRGHGSFRQAIKTLKQCQNMNIPTTLYVTVSAANVNQLDTIAKLARKYGCGGVHFNEVTIAGRALDFSNELTLSAEQSGCLPKRIARVVLDVFGEIFSEVDKRCWVDGMSVFMTADGNLYVCSEVFQRHPDLAIGNIRSFPLKAWLEHNAPVYSEHGNDCCYGVRASEHTVFVGNIASGCAFATHSLNIETLIQLYDALDELYRDIGQDCRDCRDLDCMGYIWLLEKEAERLYECSVPLVQVNGGPTFIHSFPTTVQGQLDLSVRYPQCSQLCAGGRRCNIYQDRPLVCRLYPLGFETKIDGKIVWALHRDCLYIRRLEERGLLPNFKRLVRNIINNLSSKLLGEIVETYCAVDSISSFSGNGNYSSLQEVNYVQMQGSIGW